MREYVLTLRSAAPAEAQDGSGQKVSARRTRRGRREPEQTVIE
ncbi:hypothetical protein [Methanoculleus taiwanensis]|nr:hypothetical protein [Methanoculleus taiwanensis]